MRKTAHREFDRIFNEVINSDGEKVFPNVKHIEDVQAALDVINRASIGLPMVAPYHFTIREFEAVPPSRQTKEVAYYPKIFRNTCGMGSTFDGSGVILTSGYQGNARVYTFQMCEHEWDESGANHNRGWHPKICTKCGVDASIDSGD